METEVATFSSPEFWIPKTPEIISTVEERNQLWDEKKSFSLFAQLNSEFYNFFPSVVETSSRKNWESSTIRFRWCEL